jgi:hypothetical protein
VSAIIYIEGGGDSKELHVRCREGFRKLLEKCGFAGRLPRLVACGTRNAAFGDFRVAHEQATASEFVGLLVDSEDPVADVNAPWIHLKSRDQWSMPDGAAEVQVLLMTTCMETWIVSDRSALTSHYGQALQESALPPLMDLEDRAREDIQNKLVHATRNCGNRYEKGRRSFEILSKLDPNVMSPALPSFARLRSILSTRLEPPARR